MSQTPPGAIVLEGEKLRRLLAAGEAARAAIASELRHVREAGRMASALRGVALQALEDRRRRANPYAKQNRDDDAGARPLGGRARSASDSPVATGAPSDADGFAAMHGGDPAEAADARAAARVAARTPALADAVGSGALPADVARQLERTMLDDETLAAWAEFSGTVPADTLRELANAAARGQQPGPDLARDARVLDGRTSDRGWRVDRTLSLSHHEGYVWWAAFKKASKREGVKVRVTQTELLAHMLFTLERHIALAGLPVALDAIRPFGEYHLCPIRQIAWLQAGRRRLEIGLDEVPAPGPGVRCAAVAQSSRFLEPDELDLAAEYPELVDVPEVAPGRVWYGASTTIARQARTPEAPPGDLPELPQAGATLHDAAIWCDATCAHIAAAAGTAVNRLRCREVQLVLKLTNEGGRWASDGRALGYSSRTWRDALRVGQAMTGLPAVAAAFAAGSLCYAAVRALTRRPVWRRDESPPRPKVSATNEAAWVELAHSVTVAELESFLASATPGALPPVAPAGETPVRPLGGKVVERLRVRLERRAARLFVRYRRHLRRLGVRGGPGRELAALVGWYLRATQDDAVSLKGGKNHWVVYQRSPDTKVPNGDPAAWVAPELRHIRDRRARFARAFRWLFDHPDGAQHGLKAGRVFRGTRPRGARPTETDDEAYDLSGLAVFAATQGAGEPDDGRLRIKPPEPGPGPGRRHVPLAIELARRWLDGEVCAVPGCTRDRITQHDHFKAVKRGGEASRWDKRLCGPCNRAKDRGRLSYRHAGVGIVVFFDARHRALGSVSLGGPWVEPILEWAERLARHKGSGSGGLEQTTPRAHPPDGPPPPEPDAA